jgi:hypothetical protein
MVHEFAIKPIKALLDSFPPILDNVRVGFACLGHDVNGDVRQLLGHLNLFRIVAEFCKEHSADTIHRRHLSASEHERRYYMDARTCNALEYISSNSNTFSISSSWR